MAKIKPPPTAYVPAPVIDPNQVFSLSQAAATLGLAKTSLPREIRARRLIAYRRCGRNYILGKDLLNWITSNPVRPHKLHQNRQPALETFEQGPIS